MTAYETVNPRQIIVSSIEDKEFLHLAQFESDHNFGTHSGEISYDLLPGCRECLQKRHCGS